MTAINRINLSKLKNEPHVQFNENVNSVITTLAPENLPFEALCAPYKQMFDREKAALLLITKSEITIKIVEQDKIRDNIFRGLSDTLKGLRNHYETEMQVAANRLWNGIFTHFGNVTKKTFDAETAAINDIIRELKRPEMVTAVNELNIQGWVNKLEEENNKFHALMMERYCETTEKTTFRMRTARVDTDKFYRAIVASVENEVLLGNASETLTHFITELNAIIHRFKTIMAHEHSSKKKADDE